MYLRRERDKFSFASDSGEHCHGIVLGGDRVATLDAAATERLDLDAIKVTFGLLAFSSSFLSLLIPFLLISLIYIICASRYR